MTTADETKTEESKPRLSFNQKFWLSCIGGPLLLFAIFLIIAVAIPKLLTPTEQKLLGTWEYVDPRPSATRKIIEFRENEVVHGPRSWSWRADDSYLITDMLSGSPTVLQRIKLSIGLAEDLKWDIKLLNQKELRINNSIWPDPMVFKRLDSEKN